MGDIREASYQKLIEQVRTCLDGYLSSHQGDLALVNALICVPTEINPLGDNGVDRDAICRDLRDFLSSSRLEVELFSVQVEPGGTISYQFQLSDPESMSTFDLQLMREDGVLRLFDDQSNDWIIGLDTLTQEDQEYFYALFDEHIEEISSRS